MSWILMSLFPVISLINKHNNGNNNIINRIIALSVNKEDIFETTSIFERTSNVIVYGIYGTSLLSLLYAASFIPSYLQQAAILKQAASRELARKLNRPELVTLELTDYEARLANDTVVAQDELITRFDDIGGMDEELENVKDNIVLPITLWKVMKGQSSIAPCPTGVLLYGKPGTGKTLTARALAKECNCTFLQVTGSSILDKWFGESDKLVTALFSLARKLSPTIIFIDEIEAILRKRSSNEHMPAISTMQSVLLSEWDGLKNISFDYNGPVLVVGATNRPNDIDQAFLRRLAVTVKTNPPDKQGRVEILKKMLSNELLDENVSIETIADETTNFTGSDLRELVRSASIQKAKKILNQVKKSNISYNSRYDYKLLSSNDLNNVKLTMDDFDYALSKTSRSENVARDYSAETEYEENHNSLDKFLNLFNKIKSEN